jgi:hypothetical protein
MVHRDGNTTETLPVYFEAIGWLRLETGMERRTGMEWTNKEPLRDPSAAPGCSERVGALSLPGIIGSSTRRWHRSSLD